ncbi:hypothetical protein PtB15_2B831 [Puccinia triticina]|nr:hypothetical protein PtB15_2B831 [Puccinia triticina]
MPTNTASGASCTISLVSTKTEDGSETTTTKEITCQEYRHGSSLDPITHVFKEVVTIESPNSGKFKIHLDIKPTACCVLEKSAVNLCGRTKAQKSLQPHDYVARCGPCRLGWNPLSTKSSDLRLRATRPYQFAPIKLVDPDEQQELCQDENIIKSLGTIELRIYRCKLLATLRQENTSAFKTTNEMSFSESSKNARLTSTAGLGKPAIKERKHKTQQIFLPFRRHLLSAPNYVHSICIPVQATIDFVGEGIIPNPVMPAEPSVIDFRATSIAQPKPTPKVATINSDSEAENKDRGTQTQIKTEDSNNYASGSGSGCQCNCKNKRPAEDDGQVAEGFDQKRACTSNPDQKPDVNQRTQPSKPIFIDLTL